MTKYLYENEPEKAYKLFEKLEELGLKPEESECLAVECGEGECARAIATKFPDLVTRYEEE